MTVLETAVTISLYIASSAKNYRRQTNLPKIDMSTTIPEQVYQFCTSHDSVSAELAKDPSLAPRKAVEKLYGHIKTSIIEKHGPEKRVRASDADLQRAYECGKWGPTRPSDLFLRIFHDALLSLEADPMVNVMSPSLMGSCGAIPLTILAPLPDLVRHMSNLIVRAEREVFFATNYWMVSYASTLITDAMKELSRRAGKRGQRIVMKLMYDRGNPKQVLSNHQHVKSEEYTTGKVCLPKQEEIPNIDLEVINFHRPTFGTFHSKFMVVDRKYGVVSSNNIQDNDNLEMLTHLEGPIVDSLYDVCLVSWHDALEPPLSTNNTPASQGGYPSFDDPSWRPLFEENNCLRVSETDAARNLEQVVASGQPHLLPLHEAKTPHYDNTIAEEITRTQSNLSPRDGKSRVAMVADCLNRGTRQTREATAPDCRPDEEMTPYIPHPVMEPFPIALVNRKPWGAPNHSCVNVPQNEAWLSAVRNAEREVFIQTPDLNAVPLLPEIVAAVKRGVEVTYYVCLGYNDAGELLPKQGGTNEMVANKLYQELRPEERKRLHVGYYVGKDQIQPIHNKFKSRSCHVKLLIADRHIGIQGNGNQDTQSYYHSQEVNILIDSPAVCGAWLDAIHRNQNTHLYGMASQHDGIWRDAEGREAEGAIGKDPGRFSWARGIKGAVDRVRGVGGF